MKPRKTAPKAAAKAGAKRAPPRHSAPNGARWALVSDGTFMLLGSAIEIPREAARALVDFVRALDGGAA